MVVATIKYIARDFEINMVISIMKQNNYKT